MSDHISAPQWLADLYDERDRARTIAVALEQENAELRAERLRFAADYAELAAEHARALRAADLGEFQLWQPLHTACIPDPEVGYGINVHRLRTAEDFDWWNAHLAGKSWTPNTDWQDIYAAGGHHD